MSGCPVSDQRIALLDILSTVKQLKPAELGLNFTFYAIETEFHSIIFTEGMPVETKGNSRGNSRAFDNWDEYLSLYGENRRDYPVLPNQRIRLVDELPAQLVGQAPSVRCIETLSVSGFQAPCVSCIKAPSPR